MFQLILTFMFTRCTLQICNTPLGGLRQAQELVNLWSLSLADLTSDKNQNTVAIARIKTQMKNTVAAKATFLKLKVKHKIFFLG